MLFFIIITIVVLQRLLELVIAKRNEVWLIKQGGFEVGKDHYKYIVTLHVLFFVSFISEVVFLQKQLSVWWYMPFAIFLIAQMLRVWSISSLGKYWNTRIMVLPGSSVIQKGPYRFLRHPNYVIVILEILSLPLIFDAYFTAVLFTILNMAVLSIRIRIEEHALKADTDYNLKFETKARFFPRIIK